MREYNASDSINNGIDVVVNRSNSGTGRGAVGVDEVSYEIRSNNNDAGG